MPTTTTHQMQISNWKAHEKNTLRGFFTIITASGLIINDCTLHQKGDRRWVGLPAREYTDTNGDRTFATLLAFIDRPTSDRFQTAALDALDRYFSHGFSHGVDHEQSEGHN